MSDSWLLTGKILWKNFSKELTEKAFFPMLVVLITTKSTLYFETNQRRPSTEVAVAQYSLIADTADLKN